MPLWVAIPLSLGMERPRLLMRLLPLVKTTQNLGAQSPSYIRAFPLAPMPSYKIPFFPNQCPHFNSILIPLNYSAKNFPSICSFFLHFNQPGSQGAKESSHTFIFITQFYFHFITQFYFPQNIRQNFAKFFVTL